LANDVGDVNALPSFEQLADAYEEVEEQRQVVGQWKRRVQKLNGEMHDLRLLLEEQTARNNLLEKKQRK
jgi:myosin-18